ncbi:MAG: efflux RND transporter periplasmic adaptor subunit [Verrucomicrobiota bacterium]
MKLIRLAFRILAPIAVLAVAASVAWYFVSNKSDPPKNSPPPSVTKVEATRLQPQSHQIFLESQGTVQPQTVTTFIPEVSGRIVSISPSFREGGFFEEGEILVQIDPLNYETAVTVAEAEVSQSERALAEERARAEQAMQNWRRLGKSGDPGPLAAREPQVAEAEAAVKAAQARLARARRDLERTEVKAPFAGRIVEKQVDVGQFVGTNTQLAEAFATDVVEVRLPLTNRQLAFVTLPESFRGNESTDVPAPEVLLTTRLGRETAQWQGRVVRVESMVDERSRQLFVVAEVEDPYRRDEESGQISMKIGAFFEALIKGDLLEGVFVLPRQAVRVSGEVIVVREDNTIERRAVDPIWTEEEFIVIEAGRGGLETGEVVCLTPLSYPANGAPVIPTIDGITPDIEQPPGFMPGKGGKGKGKSKGGKAGKAKASPNQPQDSAEGGSDQSAS